MWLILLIIILIIAIAFLCNSTLKVDGGSIDDLFRYIETDTNCLVTDSSGIQKEVPCYDAFAYAMTIKGNVGEIDKMNNGWSPLLYAIKYERPEIVQILLENGADMRMKPYEGVINESSNDDVKQRYPIVLAVYKYINAKTDDVRARCMRIIMTLLEKITPSFLNNHRDYLDKTALMLAAEALDENLVSLLLSHRASMFDDDRKLYTDKNGDSVLTLILKSAERDEHKAKCILKLLKLQVENPQLIATSKIQPKKDISTKKTIETARNEVVKTAMLGRRQALFSDDSSDSESEPVDW